MVRRTARQRDSTSDAPSRARLIASIEALATPNQLTPTRTTGLTVYAWDAAKSHMHFIYRPSLCVLLRGEKVARVGSQTFSYDRDRFFFTAVPLPAELIVKRAGPGSLVGLVLELDVELVARVALEIEDVIEPGRRRSECAPAVMFTGQLSPTLVEALERLVSASVDPVRHRVLHRGLLREVVFELLTSPQGPALQQAVHEAGKLRAFIDVMRFIEQHSTEALSMPQLADRAGMSESGFYARFRDATGTTPLQYLKSLRLTKARVQLAAGASSVTDVAFDVGYASSAQFSRDFRKAFGCPPSALKGQLDVAHAGP